MHLIPDAGEVKNILLSFITLAGGERSHHPSHSYANQLHRRRCQTASCRLYSIKYDVVVEVYACHL
ncbi:hypothetical protein Plhal304r1_c039g0117241 [Plasmopara halstedii]